MTGTGSGGGPSTDVVRVRLARPADLPALEALIERSSPDTVHRRFHGPFTAAGRRELERIASPSPEHRSWVAVTPDGTVRGTATLARGRDGSVEVALLVEDAQQRRGVGRRLVAAMRRHADRVGITSVEARLQGDNRVARQFLVAMAPGVATRFEDGVSVATIGPRSARPPTPTLISSHGGPSSTGPASRTERGAA